MWGPWLFTLLGYPSGHTCRFFPGPEAAYLGLGFAKDCEGEVGGAAASWAGLSGWNLFMFQELFISEGLILKSQPALVIRKRLRGFSKIGCDQGVEG